MELCKKITQGDIATRSGYSRITVSKALNDSPLISDNTKQKILTIANEMGYSKISRKSAANSKPSTSSNGTVIILSTVEVVNPFWNHIFLGIQQYLEKRGFVSVLRMLTYDFSHLSHEVIFGGIDSTQVKGFIVTGRYDKGFAQAMSTYHKTLVFVDTYTNAYTSELSGDVVYCDSFTTTIQLTEHLISQGHRKIGFLGDAFICKSQNDKWAGFCVAMFQHHLSVQEEYCYLGAPQIDTYTDGYDIDRYLDKMPSLPTAFVCHNDDMAVGAIRYLALKGLRVPEDVAITGFGNYIQFTPTITTVEVNRTGIGIRAAEELLWRLDHPDEPFETIITPTKLIIRESSRTLHKNI